MSEELAPLFAALSGLVNTLQQQQVSGSSNIKESLKGQIINFESFDENYTPTYTYTTIFA